MFSIFEPSQHGRRDFLRIGSMALGGLSLGGLPLAGAAAKPLRKKSVVLLFLQGGPPQIETFDPKRWSTKRFLENWKKSLFGIFDFDLTFDF